MKILNNYQAMGDVVRLNRTHPKHFSDQVAAEDKDVVQSFAVTLNNALKKVNEKQITSDELTQQMIINPNKVNVHTVMIAQQEALMSLNFLTQIRDKVIKAYQEIMSMR